MRKQKIVQRPREGVRRFEVAEVPGAGDDLKLCGGYRARSTLLEASDEVFAPLGQERAVFHRLLDKILETLRGRG